VTEDRTGVGEFAVELPVFSGPFRLLAELLLEHRIDVCDVSVAKVTDAFLAHASDAERWDLEEATWFVAVGASLLELKVGRLMPKQTDPDEEDLLGASPDLAYARSLELAAFRKVALDLARRFEDGARYFAREAGPPEEFAHLYPDVMENVTPDQLAAVAAVALRPPPLVDLSHVQPVRATVAEALETMRDRMASLGTARFRELVADCEERIHVVVRFLALLEMYREGDVELSQAGTFGEIEVRLTAGAG
jgi:segregation and condensation protein A